VVMEEPDQGWIPEDRSLLLLVPRPASMEFVVSVSLWCLVLATESVNSFGEVCGGSDLGPDSRRDCASDDTSDACCDDADLNDPGIGFDSYSGPFPDAYHGGDVVDGGGTMT